MGSGSEGWRRREGPSGWRRKSAGRRRRRNKRGRRRRRENWRRRKSGGRCEWLFGRAWLTECSVGWRRERATGITLRCAERLYFERTFRRKGMQNAWQRLHAFKRWRSGLWPCGLAFFSERGAARERFGRSCRELIRPAGKWRGLAGAGAPGKLLRRPAGKFAGATGKGPPLAFTSFTTSFGRTRRLELLTE